MNLWSLGFVMRNFFIFSLLLLCMPGVTRVHAESGIAAIKIEMDSVWQQADGEAASKSVSATLVPDAFKPVDSNTLKQNSIAPGASGLIQTIQAAGSHNKIDNQINVKWIESSARQQDAILFTEQKPDQNALGYKIDLPRGGQITQSLGQGALRQHVIVNDDQWHIRNNFNVTVEMKNTGHLLNQSPARTNPILMHKVWLHE